MTEPCPSFGIGSEIDPRVCDGLWQILLGCVDNDPSVSVEYAISHPWGVDHQAWRAGGGRFHDGESPPFVVGRVEQEPGFAE